MADDKVKTSDTFAEKIQTPTGEKPAYPQVIYAETGEKYADGSPVMKQIGVAKNVDEHKKMLAGQKSWGK